jgi:hypothetical protein
MDNASEGKEENGREPGNNRVSSFGIDINFYWIH